jgi:uncharacterized protein (DUF427 family)
VEAKPIPERVRVTLNGTVIADSQNVIKVVETGHDSVYYFPREDARMDLLQRTSHRSHCPFKGDASYFSISGEPMAENAVWTYEEPYDEVSIIKDRLAFYPNKVESISVVDAPVR